LINFIGLVVSDNSIDTRIIGGEPATLGQIPWQASLRINNKHTCGGSILTDRWVISAAHCFLGAAGEELTVSMAVSILTLIYKLPTVDPNLS
jgi:secreted trypsin-like serine protease